MIFSKHLTLLGLFVRASFTTAQTSKAQYLSYVESATNVLNQLYYNSTTGKWQNGWWESGAMITTIGNVALVDPSLTTSMKSYLANSFQNVPHHNPYGYPGTFLDGFYDDEGWWAMGWIKTYDLTHNSTYLNTAVSIWQDMLGGLNATCGGHWWNKPGSRAGGQTNTAIGQVLWLSVSAALGNRFPSNSTIYRRYAQDSADYLLTSGYLNSQNGYLHDYLSVKNDSCDPADYTLSYDNGQFIGGLIELAQLTKNETYLDVASKVANGTIAKLAPASNGGILTDLLAQDSGTFKGVFLRYLMALQALRPTKAWVTFIQTNADYVWENDRAGNGTFGLLWKGDPIRNVSQGTQGSAIDLFVAAANVTEG